MAERLRDPIVRTVPQPADMNGNGDIFGGWVLSQMDVAGGSLAARVAKGRVATVAITAMTFVQPIKVGDMVSIYGTVAKVGRTSITIDLETIVQRRHDSAEIQVTHGTFVFVAIDDDGKPRPVPPLVAEGAVQERRQREARIRRQTRLAHKAAIREHRRGED